MNRLCKSVARTYRPQNGAAPREGFVAGRGRSARVSGVLKRCALALVLWAGSGFASDPDSDPIKQLRQWEDSAETLDWAIREASSAAVVDSEKVDSLKNIQLKVSLEHKALREEMMADADPDFKPEAAVPPHGVAGNWLSVVDRALWIWAAIGLGVLLLIAYWYWFKRPFDGHRVRRKFQQANAADPGDEGSGSKSSGPESPKRAFHSLPEVAREAMEESGSQSPAIQDPIPRVDETDVEDDWAATPEIPEPGVSGQEVSHESTPAPPPEKPQTDLGDAQSGDSEQPDDSERLRRPAAFAETAHLSEPSQHAPDMKGERPRITDKIEIQRLTILRLAKRGATASEISQRLRISREKVELVIRHALENKH